MAYNRIPKILRQYKTTRHTDFLEKYHKNTKWTHRVAYLAGLIDGEGSIGMYTDTLRMRVGMTDKRTIDWIYDNFGGNIYRGKTKSGKNFYTWTMNQGKDLFYLSLLLVPFLINKRKKVIAGLKDMIKKFEKLEFTLNPYCRRKEAEI